MNVHFVLDEMASIKSLPAIDDAIQLGRGYGIRLQMYFQSLAQIQMCFPEGQSETVLANTTQIFFSVSSQETANLVSKRLDEKTIVVDSGGSSRGNNTGMSYGRERSSSHGSNSGTSSSWELQKRALLTPGEVIGLSQRACITFTPSLPPIRTHLIRHYEEKHLGRRNLFRRFLAASITLALSASLCAVSILIAMALTNFVNKPHLAVQQYHPTGIFGQPL